MTFFKVSGSSLWGDYGHILINGMSCHLPRKDSLIQLERTGPFIPPITLPGIGDIVVTSAFKEELEQSPFTQLAFAPVNKARIVEYHWEQWDRTSDEPDDFPDGGEPEDYILLRPHSPRTAKEIGSLWEVVLPEDAEVKSVQGRQCNWTHKVNRSTWQGSLLFRAKGKGLAIATDEAKRWLENRAGEWLEFEELQTL